MQSSQSDNGRNVAAGRPVTSSTLPAETSIPSKSKDQPFSDMDESEQERIERLGRMRPDKFKSIWEEVGFCFSVVMSQALTEYFVSGFNVILPTVSESLDIPRASQTWPAAAFSLVVSSFLLTFGRLSDMFGGFPVYIGGIAWLFIWSIVAANAQNELMMDFCRALQGLGPAAYLPSSLMLLGSIYRPGPRKNVIFSIYGAMAPLGFYIGIFFAGVTAEFTTWSWYFYIGAILAAITGVTAWFTIPSDIAERRKLNIKMDWMGAILISSGLVLVVFAITDSAHAPNGWATPYIPTLLVVGLILLAVAAYVEGWIAEAPLVPASLFKVKYMTPLIIALLFSYGTLGIYLLYATFYMSDIMGASPIQLVAWFTPCALGGCIIATVGGFLLHIIPGTILMVISGIAWILAPLMFAIMPVGASYWAYVFPAMIFCTIAIDVTFNVANIFITTSLPLRQQGLGGALVNSILQLGIAIALGFADIVATETADKGLRKSYQATFWFELGLAAVSLALLVGFVKIDKAKSQLTADEIAELAQAHEAQSSADESSATAPKLAEASKEEGEGI